MLTGVTRRVSVGAAGQANGGSLSPAISADGRFVAFNSYASNLVPGDTNGTTDIFVRDLLARVTRRVSVGPAGQGNSDSSGVPAISADGRFVTFTSSASNLVPGDTNGAIDVFVRDLQAGVTKRVSVGTGGQANDYSFFATISADGRFVAFESFAANLVPGDTNGTSDIFVRDLQAGVTRRVSVGAAGQGNSDSSGAPAISADGRYVAFFSHASNLVPGDTNGAYDIFVRDLLAGVTRRVSVGASGQGNRDSLAPAITADGRSVAFVSASFNLVTHDTNRAWDVFVRDPLLDATIGDRGSKQLSYD
jgi:Tol biopolymer transport system component